MICYIKKNRVSPDLCFKKFKITIYNVTTMIVSLSLVCLWRVYTGSPHVPSDSEQLVKPSADQDNRTAPQYEFIVLSVRSASVVQSDTPPSSVFTAWETLNEKHRAKNTHVHSCTGWTWERGTNQALNNSIRLGKHQLTKQSSILAAPGDCVYSLVERLSIV